MAKISFQFKRITQAFDEGSRPRLCQSSGSEHSAELSDLVNSFIEKNYERDYEEDQKEKEKVYSDTESYWSRSETKDTLQRLLGNCDYDSYDDDEDEDNKVKLMIRAETEIACKNIGTVSSQGFKRQLMSRLRDRGLDAGLCKSRWKKIGQFPAGDYEYIDVMYVGTRYIVEVNLAGEFTIARPVNNYQSLLDVFPQIFVGKPDTLKQVVRLICAAAKQSMKNRDMHLPPWRKNGYMQAKWFGSYKRSSNAVTTRNVSDSGGGFAKNRSVGFEMAPVVFHYCRDHELGRKVSMRVGHLAQALDGTNCN